MKSVVFRIALCLIWLAAAAAGTVKLMNFESGSGSSGSTPESWPAISGIPLDAKRPTLLLFIHPHCSCTRASIEELNRLMARNPGKCSVTVFVLEPEALGKQWAMTESRAAASSIPGVSVVADHNGKIASRFGAETSGYVTLFDPGGKLLFHGGITAARGRYGYNSGSEIISSLLAGKRPFFGLQKTPVYGCSLLDGCPSPAATEAKL